MSSLFSLSSTVYTFEEVVNQIRRVLLTNGRSASRVVDPLDTSDSNPSDKKMEKCNMDESPIEMNSNHWIILDIALSLLNDLILAFAIKSTVGDGKYPERNLEKYGEDEWTKENSTSNYYVRNQSRPEKAKATMSASKIELDILKLLLSHSSNKSRFWFHVKSWQSAEKLCARIHRYLVGCIFFENLYHPGIKRVVCRSRSQAPTANQRVQTRKHSRHSRLIKPAKRSRCALRDYEQ